MRNFGRVRRAALVAVALALTVTMGSATRAVAEGDIQIGDQQLLTSTSEPFFVGGDYQWGLDQIWVPSDPATSPVSVTFAWGDGTSDTVVSNQTYPDLPVWQGCDGSRCFAWVGHTYAAQGLYTITVMAEQEGATPATYPGVAAIHDVGLAASVKGSGTLTARTGGMYDQEFTQGVMSFQLSVKRRAGTAATSGSLWVDVPSMRPDYPPGSDSKGMTFSGTAPTQPLYVAKGATRGTYEVYLDRVYGTVTKLVDGSKVSAGTAYATLHATITKGQPTLVRIHVWNTSAGYTYVDTATADQGVWGLDLDNALLSGSLKIG